MLHNKAIVAAIYDRFASLSNQGSVRQFLRRRRAGKPSEAAFSTISSNFHKCRPELAGEVMSGVAVEQVGMDTPATSGESRLSILQPTGNS